MSRPPDGATLLWEALRTEDEGLRPALRADPPSAPTGPGPAQLAAAGPRAERHTREYELLMEMIYEGTLLHYGAPRVFETPDHDLRLLLGDRLYAAGLARLAELGDLEAVAELADLISLLAQAEAADDAPLTAAIWAAGARAIGWGASPEHEMAKALARSGSPRAGQALDEASAGAGS
jgi:hypothetical protein